jgi:nucleotide-binding universal stress UspA family protein
MLTEILVVVDDTIESEKALDVAKQFLAPWGKLIVVRVVTRLDMSELLERFSYGNIGYERAQRKIDTVLEEIERHVRRLLLDNQPDTKYEILLPIGEPDEEIPKIAEHLNIQAIVLHKHVYRQLDCWFFRRITSRIVNNSPCPVILVTSQMKIE